MEHYGITFKEMNKKQKVKHIWVYYRYHILAVIIATFVVGSLGKSILFPKEPHAVDILFVGMMNLDETSNEVKDLFEETYDADLNFNMINWESGDEASAMMMQKVPILVSMSELDVMAIATEPYKGYCEAYGKDMMLALDEVPELAPLLEAYEERLYICDKALNQEGELVDVEPHVYGIITKDFNNITCLTANEEMIVGLSGNVKNLDKAISMLEYIVE